jgi:hypothetical protein
MDVWMSAAKGPGGEKKKGSTINNYIRRLVLPIPICWVGELLELSTPPYIALYCSIVFTPLRHVSSILLVIVCTTVSHVIRLRVPKNLG